MTTNKKKKEEERVDLDTRPYPNPIFENYDYGGSEDGKDEEEKVVGPGRGLYNGSMDKYKSVTEFLDKARRREYRKKAMLRILARIL